MHISTRTKANKRDHAATKIQAIFRKFAIRQLVHITRKRFQICAQTIGELILSSSFSQESNIFLDFESSMSWPFTFCNISPDVSAASVNELEESWVSAREIAAIPECSVEQSSEGVEKLKLVDYYSLKEEEAWLEKAIRERIQLLTASTQQ